MRAKSFLYVSLGILALALAFHFGASAAGAQGSGNSIVAMASWGTNNLFAVTSLGDVYQRDGVGVWHREANVFAGVPTPASGPTWGQVKARYR